LNKNKSEKQYQSDYYARSIFNLAKAENTVERVEMELLQLKDQILKNMELKNYLSDTSIPEEEKIKFMFDLIGEDVSRSTKAFISLLIIMDALEYIEQVHKDYVDLTDRLKKQVSIEVVSAVELDNSTIRVIKEDIDKKTGLDVRIRNTIDKSIIGGIVIRIGERIIDLSINNKIDDLKMKLKGLELKEEEFGTEN
jgi:F-type H+-transporting ATPase subunit delta